jgi:hypothetical protein
MRLPNLFANLFYYFIWKYEMYYISLWCLIKKRIMKDLFETPELIPDEVQAVLETFDENVDPYKELARLVNEIEPLGYTFDYYLDAEPYGLRPIEVELVELEGWENIND